MIAFAIDAIIFTEKNKFEEGKLKRNQKKPEL